MKKSIIIIILLCLFGCGSEDVKAEEIELDTKVYIRSSWVDYCERYDKEYLKTYEKSTQDIRDVLYPLYDNFNYVYDVDRWGHDQWDMLNEAGEGDCDDFAITLREKLIESGFRRSNVLLADGVMFKNGRYSGHMVCIVKVYMGQKFVVDYSEIIPIEEYDDIFWQSKLDESGLYWTKYYGEAKEVKIEY